MRRPPPHAHLATRALGRAHKARGADSGGGRERGERVRGGRELRACLPKGVLRALPAPARPPRSTELGRGIDGPRHWAVPFAVLVMRTFPGERPALGRPTAGAVGIFARAVGVQTGASGRGAAPVGAAPVSQVLRCLLRVIRPGHDETRVSEDLPFSSASAAHSRRHRARVKGERKG